MPILDLTQHEEQNFDALPPGRYFANVFEIEERYTKGSEGAKLPAETPMIWVHFQITGRVGEDDGANEESPYYNRRAFTNMPIPPDDYELKARKAMNGRIVSFFKALGIPEEELTSGTFEPDLEDYVEKELVVRLNRKERNGELQNNVVGYQSMDEVESTTEASGLL